MKTNDDISVTTGTLDAKAEALTTKEDGDAKQDAKQDATANGDKGKKAKAGENVDPMEQLVEVELLYDGKGYVDDVDVCINGKRILIQRGKRVKIKRKYALVLEQSVKQDTDTRILIKQLTTDE